MLLLLQEADTMEIRNEFNNKIEFGIIAAKMLGMITER